ncbi:MAG: ABC transporter ATP-binding protein [Candidatus Bathyarchaeota archaeon]|nr:ABC transporter ATP-binding protein [Candidatus Bathyarchaeota archaeon]
MIKAKGINAGYGRAQVLFNFDFEVSEREKVAIIGPNGSGKSTLLKTLMGLTTLYSGVVEFDGKDISKLEPYERANLGLAYLPQVGSTFEDLTITENLRMAGYTMNKVDRSERMEEVLDIFPILKNYVNEKSKVLSGGMRQMLATSIALMRRPKLMMFDEPTANLAPNLAEEVLDKLIGIEEQFGITIILVEQNATMVLEACDKAYLLVNGRVNYADDARELLDNPRFGQIFLGIETV